MQARGSSRPEPASRRRHSPLCRSSASRSCPRASSASPAAPARDSASSTPTGPRALRPPSETASSSSSSVRTSGATRAAISFCGDLAEHLGVETVATGDVHAHHPRRTLLQDALVAIRCNTSLEGCEPERRGNRESVLRAPAEMLERFSFDRQAAERTVDVAARLEFDLTEELGYRYPDFSDGERAGHPSARGDLPARARGALRPKCQTDTRRQGSPPRGAAAARGRAPAHRRARPRRLLPPTPGGAGARPRDRARGARAGTLHAGSSRRGGDAGARSARSSAT